MTPPSTPAGIAEIDDGLLALSRRHAAANDCALIFALQSLTGWSAEATTASLGRAFGYAVIGPRALHELVPDYTRIPFIECSNRGILEGLDAGGRRVLVLGDPFDEATEAWALRRCSAGLTSTVLAHPADLEALLRRQEQELRALAPALDESAGPADEDVAAIITLAGISAETSAAVRLVDSTIHDALRLQASDIHLECDAGWLRVMFRIDGVLVPATQVQGQALADQAVSRVKVMAELDIAERRVPQDGRFKVRVAGRDVDLRVSVMPSLFGEDVVLRLLDRQTLAEHHQSLSLDSLGLNDTAIAAIRRLARLPHGMLLVTGPTGSGKTTTLYAAISEIHTGRDKIITIEDPVEYRLPRVLQIPVNDKKGLTFARGLRSILRHDPDQIMVGEIRDDETAQIAVQAALTGHLVLTTVHANNVFDVLGRFLHMGVDAYSFAAALNGIVAQRLIRINCPHCTTSSNPTAEGLEAAGLSGDQVQGWAFQVGKGCGHCRGTGYKGRKAVAEVLRLDDPMRELIAAKAPVSALKQRAHRAGMQALIDAALRLVARGETTLEEVLRVAI